MLLRGVRKKREVVGVGGGSHGRVCTQAVTQIYPDRHTEHVNRHMGRPCAASLPVVESKPGAKAHASQNAHTHTATHTHTHAQFSHGGSFQPCLHFLECSGGKASERSWRGERHRTVTGMALYITLKIVLVIKSVAEGEEVQAAHRCWRGLPGVRKPAHQGWSRRSLVGP